MPSSRRVADHNIPLVVQETHTPPSSFLQYIDQVVGMSPSRLTFRYSQRMVRRPDVDVLHVADQHLGLILGTSESQPLRYLLRTAYLAALVGARRIALVRTVHTPPKSPPARGLAALAGRLLDHSTSVFVTFDASTQVPHDNRRTVIPHAHFRDRFSGYPRSDPVGGRVLCVARSWLSHEADALRTAASSARAAGASFRLAGYVPHTIGGEILAGEATLDCVPERREMLSDAAQVREITASELVIVPSIDSLERLQCVYLALSLDRPVLTPWSESMAHLAARVGEGWLHLSDGPVSATSIRAALRSSRSNLRPRHPDLDGRDLHSTRAAYAEVFRSAADSRGR